MPDYYSQITTLVSNERKKYEDSSQNLRGVIKQCRQNYQNKYKQPITNNNRRKKFIPLTRWECDILTSKTFVNDKALTVLPQDEDAVFPALLMDQTLKYQINQTRFPTTFRNSLYDLSRDGTIVYASFWNFESTSVTKPKKSIKEKIKSKFKKEPTKKKINVLNDSIGFGQIDLLNCFIDPTADSIQEAPSFITRNTYSLNTVRANKLWQNTDEIKGFTTELQNQWDATSTRQWDIGRTNIQYEQPMVNVFSRWGDFPLAWITGKKKDEDTVVRNGVIEIADLQHGTPTIVRIDKNPFSHGLKPFEECWAQKVKGRWYGIGTAEKLIDIQSATNKNYNRKEENEDILHSGIFIVRRGSGISAKTIRSKPGAVIEADNVDDIKQLNIRDVSQLSNSSINMLMNFAQQATGALDIAVGSSADRSATTSIIKDRNADTRFAAIRGNINDFLIRFFNHWIALDQQFLTKEFVLRVTSEDIDFETIDNFTGITPQESEKLPNFRFIKVKPRDIKKQFDLHADIDLSQPQNKLETAQRILQGIQVGKQLQIQRDYEKLYDAYLDNLGLTGLAFKTRVPVPPIQPQGQGQAQGQPGSANPLDQLLNANQSAPQSGVPPTEPNLPQSVLGQL